MSRHGELGRTRGVWIPESEVEIHIANGWTIADPVPHRGAVLMAPPARAREMAA